MKRFTMISTMPRPSKLGSAQIAFLATLLAVADITGCVIGPYDGQQVGPHTTFLVQGLARSASTAVTVEAFNKATGAWDDITSTTSAATVTFPAGYWNNSPALYSYSFNVLVPDPCYWDASCTFPAGDFSAKIRLREGPKSNPLYDFRGKFDSLSCAYDKINAGADFAASGYECGFNDSVITLHHVG